VLQNDALALCGALHLFARLHSLIGGSPRPSPQGYDAIKISRNAWDSNFCDVNSKFLAVILEAQVRGVGSAMDKTPSLTHAHAPASQTNHHTRCKRDESANARASSSSLICAILSVRLAAHVGARAVDRCVCGALLQCLSVFRICAEVRPAPLLRH